MLSHIQHIEDTLTKHHLQHLINLQSYYTQGIGNFNLMILNHFLS